MAQYNDVIYNDYDAYLGNRPACKGHKMIDGGVCDKWHCKYGGGESYKGKVITAEFSISPKITIYIAHKHLRIVDIRYSGKSDRWIYDNATSEKLVNEHELEKDKLDKILNTKIDNCLFWNMIQRQAKEMCNNHYGK